MTYVLQSISRIFSRGKRGREGEKYWSTGDDTSSHQCHQTGEASIMVTVRKNEHTYASASSVLCREDSS